MSSSDIEKLIIASNRLQSAKSANPGTLGLFSFASTTFLLSMYNLQCRGINTPNLAVGMALSCGGLAQFVAGMWEFPRGNMFGATAFTSYGAFWLSYAAILIPGSGIIASYENNKSELQSAIGLYLITWFMVTFFFFIVSLRKSVSFIALFGLLFTTFIILAAGEFAASPNVTKIGGAVGLITAFVAYYIGVSELLAAEKNPIFRLPLGTFKAD
ncbi:hypothetical protein AMATHDRAFT_58738 [Amanita thiersii Skay4041]|uniref:Uncharacterized protein n=1 Tax=Amanita thiersii Skay4041 TaxID=703135 RepID=A0A2A9NV32_9AGAR|nr:hypothetical protein AMATHDRAFT_58738 [Amanita thiersii Skay4041]